MINKIAFLILAHKNIDQVYTQIDLLKSKDIGIFIHIDKKYNPKINDRYSDLHNVNFLKNRISVHWGGFSIVQATLYLLNAARDTEEYDYYVLLSGQCMPIKPIREFKELLVKHEGKSFLERKYVTGEMLYKFHYPFFFDNLGLIRQNIISIKGKNYEWKKSFNKYVIGIIKLFRFTRRIPKDIEPYFGSQWWCLYKDCVEYILKFIEYKKRIINYFKYTWAPDELFFQSILMSSSLRDRIVNKSLWYIDWNTNGPPKTLTMDDRDKLNGSDKYFARKFDSEVDGEIIRKAIESFRDRRI